MHYYRIYGLTVASQLDLPGVPIACGENPACDVEICEGAVPECLENPEMAYRYWSAGVGKFLIRIPDLARIYVQDGARIVVERVVDAPLDQITPFLLGSCFGAVLAQRKTLALHAASVCRDGLVFLICGRSGAGKSTTAAHLRAAGGQMLCDDLAVVHAKRPFLVEPGLPFTKLADDALLQLGTDAQEVDWPRCVTGKNVVATDEVFLDQPLPLGGIIIIELTSIGSLGSHRLSAQTAMQALSRHTYRKNYITRDVAQEIFSGWGELARMIPITQLTRPAGVDTTRQIVDMAEEAIGAMARQTRESCA